jgi:hypothetical protein
MLTHFFCFLTRPEIAKQEAFRRILKIKKQMSCTPQL